MLLVSQAGEYQWVSPEGFSRLIHGRISTVSDLFYDLKSKHIIAGDDLETSVDLLATKYRTRKGFLRDFTSLHMVVVTAYCNCRCEYCQASSCSPEDGPLSMSKETAQKVVDTILQSPSSAIKIEFQGGEPTLNWDIVRFIVEYAESVNRRVGKRLSFVICTNLTHMNQEIIRFLNQHDVMISTSLDGPKELHDRNRICRDGSSSYDAFIANLSLVRSIAGPLACSPLLTITQANLHRLREVVDEYVRLGFNGVFLRSLNPYGSARSQWSELAYPMEEFIEAYKDALDHIIKLNLNGTRFTEYYSSLLLTRILTPFSTGFVDLQSPSGTGISGAIYDYDGNVYPADEGRMLARTGDPIFCLGNVHSDPYESIFGGQRLRDLTSHGCVETLPGCAWCGFQQYCGVDPVRNYVECGDVVGHRPTSGFCRKNKSIIEHLFNMIRTADPDVMNVFWSWITNRTLEGVRV